MINFQQSQALTSHYESFWSTVHSEHLISGRWKQGLVPKIGKCHLVEMIDTYVSSLQLIGIFSAPPKNWGCGPWKPQIKIKNQIFELVLQKMS